MIELLAVIGILAVLLLLAVPSILNSRDNALKGISRAEEKNIKYAGETIGIDLDDYMSEIYNCKVSTWIESKCQFDGSGSWSSVTLQMSDLISNGYFEDKNDHCKGEITITKLESGYGVDYSKVTCK